MKINWIKFENLDTGLKINKTYFNKELTMLVGRSGAGKTQILESISTFCLTATENLSDIDCKFNGTLSFSIDKDEYEWSVELGEDSINDSPSVLRITNSRMFLSSFINDKETKNVIKWETLYCNGQEIFFRKNNELRMEGYEKIPQISSDFSLIYQYNNDKLLRKVYNCIIGLYNANSPFPISYLGASLTTLDTIKEKLKICQNTDEYRNSFPQNYATQNKLYLLKETNFKLYETFLSYYKNIFSDVDSLIFEIDDEDHRLKVLVRTNEFIIPYHSLSAGMRKTASFLVDLLTLSTDFVLLIDEIENGLGVNCLDEVYDLLLSLRDDIQLIITSHHPYIINNVNPHSCKIVNRKLNVISTYSAEELNLINSHHDFYDLIINKLQYGDIS